MRFFNTEGPVNCQDHYCLPPLSRLDMEDVMALISQKKYFLLHAPRQTGKTTCLLALADYLNQSGQYHAVYANIEEAHLVIFDRRPGKSRDERIWQRAENYQGMPITVWGMKE